jgi:deoxycytidine triphosphate deaminase
MSVLSDRDIIRELGKGIFLHPLKEGSIKACDICLTASEYAYAIGKQQRLTIQTETNQSGEEQLFFEIPPRDTALIWTDESVYLCDRFRGPLYSIVEMVSQGIGHIGTRVNPCWSGVLCLSLQNNSDNPVRINVRDVKQPIAYLAIEKLSSKPSFSYRRNVDKSARLDILKGLPNTNEIHDFFNRKEHAWMTGDLDTLKKKMFDSQEYKKIKKEIIDILISFAKSEKFWIAVTAIVSILALVIAILTFIFK